MDVAQETLDQEYERLTALTKLQVAGANRLANSQTPRAQTLHALAGCLQKFGVHQLNFCLQRLPTLTANDSWPHPLYSLQYAADVTINQIGNDLDLLLRTEHQRTLTPAEVGQIVTGFHFTLDLADRLAMTALRLAEEKIGIPKSTVLSFYQKTPAVRVIPYAPVALVGIPFTATTGAYHDVAAIIHEVGHYVYSRMQNPTPDAIAVNAFMAGLTASAPSVSAGREEIGSEATLPTIVSWLIGWKEEIFADVYACMIGGPLTGATMLEIMRRLPGTRWLEDDGDHPLPALRPRIYAETMRKMAVKAGPTMSSQLCAAACALDQATDKWLSGPLPSWLTFRPVRGTPVRIEVALREFIVPLIDYLVDHVFVDLQPQDTQPNPLWCDPGVELSQSFAALKARAQRPEYAPREIQQSQAEPDRAGFADSADTWQMGETGRNTDWELARDPTAHPIAVEHLKAAGWNPWWLGVISAGAWTTKGPGGGSPQPTG